MGAATVWDDESTTWPSWNVTTVLTVLPPLAFDVTTATYIVSRGANVLVVSMIRLSAPIVFPVSIVVTIAGGGGAGAAATESAGGASFFPQPTSVRAENANATGSVSRLRVIFCLSFFWDRENLPGVDQVRVTDLVAIRLEDGAPLLAVAVLLLRDFREAVALLHCVLHLSLHRLVRVQGRG